MQRARTCATRSTPTRQAGIAASTPREGASRSSRGDSSATYTGELLCGWRGTCVGGVRFDRVSVCVPLCTMLQRWAAQGCPAAEAAARATAAAAAGCSSLAHTLTSCHAQPPSVPAPSQIAQHSHSQVAQHRHVRHGQQRDGPVCVWEGAVGGDDIEQAQLLQPHARTPLPQHTLLAHHTAIEPSCSN